MNYIEKGQLIILTDKMVGINKADGNGKRPCVVLCEDETYDMEEIYWVVMPLSSSPSTGYETFYEINIDRNIKYFNPTSVKSIRESELKFHHCLKVIKESELNDMLTKMNIY